MRPSFSDEKNESVTEKNHNIIHKMDYNYIRVGNLPISIRSKQEMVTKSEFEEEDLKLLHVKDLRPLARSRDVASGIWINRANKDDLIDVLMGRPVKGAKRERARSREEILKSIPEKAFSDEIVFLARRMISIISEEAFQDIQRKIKENEG